MHPSGGDTDRASNGAPQEPKPGQEPRSYDQFARSVVDGLSAHVAVIEASGAIVFVNEAWRVFARENAGDPVKVSEGTNYLEACDAATGPDSETAAAFAAGAREVLCGLRMSFELEYPCHAPERRRWFVGRVTRLPGPGPPQAVVANEDVTDRKRYEEDRQEGTGGLEFMAERAALVGGTCRIGSSPLGGARVEVVVPLPPRLLPGS